MSGITGATAITTTTTVMPTITTTTTPVFDEYYRAADKAVGSMLALVGAIIKLKPLIKTKQIFGVKVPGLSPEFIQHLEINTKGITEIKEQFPNACNNFFVKRAKEAWAEKKDLEGGLEAVQFLRAIPRGNLSRPIAAREIYTELNWTQMNGTCEQQNIFVDLLINT